MLKKTMTYLDYDGGERTEDFYFNLSKAELLEMELSTEGGLQAMIQRMISTQNMKQLLELFKTLILKSYGVRSPDGKRFIKSQELTDAFTQTEAYSDLFMALTTDDVLAAEFLNGVVPKDLAAQAATMSPPSIPGRVLPHQFPATPNKD